MRKLPRSVICIFVFIFLTTITYAQEKWLVRSVVDSVVQNRGASNSSIQNKTKIPNYIQEQEFKQKVMTEAGKTPNKTSSGGMSKFTGQRFINLEIVEDEKRKGQAIGWATNSQDGVIINSDGKKVLSLKETETDLYLSKLINVQAPGELTLIYEAMNTAPSELVITKFDKNNKIISEAIKYKITMSDNFEERSQKIALAGSVARVAINFKKGSMGKLKLRKFKYSIEKQTK